LFIQVNAKFNEAESNTSQHVLNVSIPTIKANNLLKHTRKISYSLGSACTSETLDPSHVLTAMGQSKEEAFSSFRLSFSPTMTQDEIDIALNTFNTAMTSLLD
jgi:cysteine desulfurase